MGVVRPTCPPPLLGTSRSKNGDLSVGVFVFGSRSLLGRVTFPFEGGLRSTRPDVGASVFGTRVSRLYEGSFFVGGLRSTRPSGSLVGGVFSGRVEEPPIGVCAVGVLDSSFPT